MSLEPDLDHDRLNALVAKASSIAGTSGSTPSKVPPVAPVGSRKALLAGLVLVVAVAAGVGLAVLNGDDSPKTSTAQATTVASAVTTVPADGAAAAATSVTQTSAPTTPATPTSAPASATEAVPTTGQTQSPAAVATTDPIVASSSPTTAPVPVDTTVPVVPSTSTATTTPAGTATTTGATTASTGGSGAAAAPALLTGPPSEHLPGGQLWPFGLYQDNIMYLRGTVPDLATSQDIQGRAEAILGNDFVRNELVIDSTVPKVDTVTVRLGNSVLFKSGDFDIPPESEPGFILWAAFLQSNPAVKMTVIGHADSQGDPAYNASLAQRRAEIAMDRIVRNGIDASRVTAISHGEDDPIATNDTSVGRALNRRVEFAVSGLFSN